MATLALAVLPLGAKAQSAATPEQMQETRAVSGELLKTLSGKLQESMKANGPAGSITVCKTIAPQITLGLADKLKTDYPHDQATGCAPGQLRGAVVISRPL